MMIRKKIKAVYSVHIDFKYEEQERRPLKAGYSYYFQNDKKVAYKDVVDEVVQIINNDLKRECQKYVSHSIKSIESLCDRVVWLDRGKVVMTGSTDEVCAAYYESQMGK